MPANTPFRILLLLPAVFMFACDIQADEDTQANSTGESDGGGEPPPPPAPPMGAAHEPRMAANVYHPSIHVFTEGKDPSQVRVQARMIKQLALGDPDAPTCYVGPQGRAQLSVQTEFNPHEYRADNESTETLDDRLDVLFDEGLAVHLLLPIHNVDLGTWQNVDWQAKQNWTNHTTFMPMQPCPEPWREGERCPYDVLFESFHGPVIQELVASGRADDLAVIYIANEFGYNPLDIADGPADWDGAGDWKLKRAEAMAYTAQRGLDNARAAAQGRVPVGIKLIDVQNTKTGWTPEQGVNGDQLSYLLNDVMGPNGDVLGYDAYFDNLGFDGKNRTRLAQYANHLDGGQFELAEYGRICSGLPGQFVSGSRTTASDITGGAAAWSNARGLNLFAFNTAPDDIHAGCHALTKHNDPTKTYLGAEAEAAGLWAQIQAFTGSQDPQPCVGPDPDPGCSPEDCDDQNSCTDDSCVNDSCVNEPVAKGTPCPGGTCEAGVCVADSCGDGNVDVGEQCDGVDLASATCENRGYDDGILACLKNCTFDVSQCCNSECSLGSTMCSNGTVYACDAIGGGCGAWDNGQQCPYGCDGNICDNVGCGDGVVNQGEQCDGGNLGGASCESLGYDGGTMQCSNMCTYVKTGCCDHLHTIFNAVHPTYTTYAAGCSVGGGVGLKLSAEQISSSTIRFHIRKTDDTTWGSPAILRLYVGTGPSCGDPPNVVKATKGVVVNQTTQYIDLSVNPYNASWTNGETKEFWVGKSESGWDAGRATGTISIQRTCQ